MRQDLSSVVLFCHDLMGLPWLSPEWAVEISLPQLCPGQMSLEWTVEVNIAQLKPPLERYSFDGHILHCLGELSQELQL